MPDNAITLLRTKFGNKVLSFTDYVSGALTAATIKKEWVVPFFCSIVDVIVDSETNGVGGGTGTIIDVNRNGTSIYTTQANRPTLRANDTGNYKWQTNGTVPRQIPDVTRLVPGDVLSYDVDQIQTTSGVTRTKIAIIVDNR